jgi:phosphoglycolate phosphatase
MALLRFGSTAFDTDLVAFDKDGTLIGFDAMWGRLAVAWVEYLTEGIADGALGEDLYSSLGYDAAKRRADPEGPLAIATTGQVQTIVAVTLYRSGLSWPAAEDRAREAFRATAAIPLPDLIEPAGQVRTLFASLQAAGVGVAVVTTDHRAETEETLRILDVIHWVDHLVCGDDGIPAKPAPDMLLAACDRLGLRPDRTAVVGDTMGDLLMAQRAGAGLRVAVLTGAGNAELLSPHADALLASIDEISIAVDA